MKNTGRNDIKSVLGIFKKLIDADSRECGLFSLEKGFLGKAQCACEIASGEPMEKRACVPTEYSDTMNTVWGAHKIDLTFSSGSVPAAQPHSMENSKSMFTVLFVL